jgi:two-component system NarL family response regulator
MSRILLVDDNADIINLVKTILERWGYEVFAGRNGEEGLRLMPSVQPDAIISNLRMPRMDGMAFLEQVRDHAEWSEIPFVMMSALRTEEYTREALQRGANAYLAKPFQFADLQMLFSNLNLNPN